MSIIIDGMDQNHSKLPHLASNVGFSKPMDQHIQGVLEHGQGMYSCVFVRAYTV
jgi:hypothetical protein